MRDTTQSIYKRFDTSSWVNVYDFDPQDDDMASSRGKLICSIAIVVNDPESLIEPSSLGKKALSVLHRHYYGEVTQSAFNALAVAMKSSVTDVSTPSVRLSMSCMAIVGKTSYVGAVNEAKVSIFRSGGLADILSSTSEPTIASGYPKVSDVVLLSVANATKMDRSEIIQAFIGNKFEKSSQQIEDHLNDLGETYGLGLVRFGDETEMDLQDVDNGLVHEETKPTSLIRMIREKLPGRSIKVSEDNDEVVSKQRKPALAVGVIIIVLLLVSIVFGVMQKNRKDKVAKYEDRLVQAMSDFDQSVTLSAVTPSEAREKFNSSRTVTKQLTSEGVQDERLVKLIADLDQNEGAVLGVYKNAPELFVDLSLLSDGFVGSDLSSDEESVYVLANSGDRVARVDYDSKRGEIVQGPDDILSAIRIANFQDSVFYTKDDGIYESGKDRIQDKYWEGDALIQSYSGNIYLLDKAGSKIYRHNITDSGYTDANEWTKESEDRDLSQINAFTIDGLIWLLSATGKVAKYSGGVQQNFEISGLTTNLSDPKDIYTDENIENIYILDPVNSRVVVTNKEGGFVASYEDGSIAGATQIAVSEINDKALLLSGDKLFSLELKHSPQVGGDGGN